MKMPAPGPACWVVEGFWTKPEHVFAAMNARGEQQPIPDEWREWIVVEGYSWPKTLRQALYVATLVRLVELQVRGANPAPLRLRNRDTGEVEELEWYGQVRLTARYHVPGTPDTVIMPHRARLRGRRR
jgi:hypothetical protein